MNAPALRLASSGGIVFLFLASSVFCLAQTLWRGTRYGMSESEVGKLLGIQLRPTIWPGLYLLDDHERYCGGDFEIQLNFLVNPNKGLVSVYLENRTGNPNGTIGDCVLNDLTKKLGPPKITKQVEGQEYSFGNAKRRTTLYAQPNRVVVMYEGRLLPGESFW